MRESQLKIHVAARNSQAPPDQQGTSLSKSQHRFMQPLMPKVCFIVKQRASHRTPAFLELVSRHPRAINRVAPSPLGSSRFLTLSSLFILAQPPGQRQRALQWLQCLQMTWAILSSAVLPLPELCLVPRSKLPSFVRTILFRKHSRSCWCWISALKPGFCPPDVLLQPSPPHSFLFPIY
jgi:hypothetical protein